MTEKSPAVTLRRDLSTRDTAWLTLDLLVLASEDVRKSEKKNKLPSRSYGTHQVQAGWPPRGSRIGKTREWALEWSGGTEAGCGSCLG